MYEDLCRATGEERMKKINELQSYELDLICSRVKHCNLCPLALHYGDGDLLCMDYATLFQIRNVLRTGGHFKELEGV